MAKKSATYLDYEVVVEDNGAITVRKGGEQISNVMGAIREIASLTGYEINEKHNTRQSGSKLVDFLKTLPAGAAAPAKPAEPAPKPAPSAPKAAPAPKPEPAKEQLKTTQTEELTEEEMKQLDDLLKRLEALEARIAKLESGAPAAPAGNSQQNAEKLTLVKSYWLSLSSRKYNSNGLLEFDKDCIKQVFDYYHRNYNEKIQEKLQSYVSRVKEAIANCRWNSTYWDLYMYELGGKSLMSLSPDVFRFGGWSLVLLSNGKLYTKHSGGHELNDLKAVATLLNIDVPKGTRKEKLAAELVAKYGNGRYAVISGHIVSTDCWVHSLTETNVNRILIEFQQNLDKINENFNALVPLRLDDSMTNQEKLDSIVEYLDGLTRKIEPASAAAQAEEFGRVAKEVFHELGVDL